MVHKDFDELRPVKFADLRYHSSVMRSLLVFLGLIILAGAFFHSSARENQPCNKCGSLNVTDPLCPTCLAPQIKHSTAYLYYFHQFHAARRLERPTKCLRVSVICPIMLDKFSILHIKTIDGREIAYPELDIVLGHLQITCRGNWAIFYKGKKTLIRTIQCRYL